MMDYSINVLLNALSILNSKGVRSDKIMIQKFLFFVDCYGIKTGFKFEPYTYGPFSFELAAKTQSLTSLKMIGIGPSGYVALHGSTNHSFSEQIEKTYSIFDQVMGHRFYFGDLECVGTLIYCILSLKKSGKPDLENESIIHEFKGWKGTKYADDMIQDYLCKLRQLNLVDEIKIH